MSELTVRESDKIPGLFFVEQDFRSDERGWFKENYQKEKLEALGLPHLGVVQHNISFNADKGVTRGVHAEPWDKFISIAHGSIFVAIVDLRAGDNFGAIETFEIDTTRAFYLPKGCGNSFQTLEKNTVYNYLVNAHWSPEAEYTMVNLNDETLNIQWPTPLEDAIVSQKDKNHPLLNEVEPIEDQT